MDLKVMLPRHHVLLHLSSGDRREILTELMEPLVNDSLVTCSETFLEDLERREDEVPTQLEAGIAFPHARSGAVRRLALAVGIADPPGLTFSTRNPDRCRLFFLIGVPAFAPTAHLQLLQQLAGFARDSKSTTKLLACKTPAQAVRCLIASKSRGRRRLLDLPPLT